VGLGYRPRSSNLPDSAFTGTSEEDFARLESWYWPNPKYPRRNCETKGLCSRSVDDEFELPVLSCASGARLAGVPGNNRPGVGTKETMELQKLINHCADALSQPRCAYLSKAPMLRLAKLSRSAISLIT
jgi:hypothetical protein